MSTKRSVLVTGASGQQGGAVARALLSRGHRVKALTRKPAADAARQLKSAGADVVVGDLGDAASILKAAGDVGAMFLMGNVNETGAEQETRQGIVAAEAAKDAGVGYLIYSSVADANKKTGIPHFDSKYLVEKHIAGLGIPYTISAPASFMENIVAPWSIGALRQGTLAFPMPPKRVIQLIALTDIGAFVAALIERRDQVFGKRFDLAGDELSGEEQAKILSHAIGRPINYQEIPIAAARQQSEDVALMFEWFDRVGADADIAALRRDFSEVRWHSFADWAREFDWERSNRDLSFPTVSKERNMTAISVIIGSTRQGRFSEKPAQWIFQRLKNRGGIDARLLDLGDFPMPFFDQPVPPAMPGRPPYDNEVVKKWTAEIARSDGFIFVTPEYNYGPAAVLKNALDWVYPEWNRKAAAFVSYGSAAGARSVQQLRETAIELQLAPVRSSVHIPVATLWAHFKGGDVDAGLAELEVPAKAMIDDLLWWTEALRVARTA